MKMSQARFALYIVAILAAYAFKEQAALPKPANPELHGQLETLIVGGGPTLRNNQAAIESNVRYVNHLLPEDASRKVLFADGSSRSKTVLCEGEARSYFRPPELSKIDGPATNRAVGTELSSLAKDLSAKPGLPALLYFTGHGGGDVQGDFQNNYYCTWNDDQFFVSDLAQSLNSFPKSSPIALVMVECFSGGFGNVLFEGGKRDAPLVNRPICGFFACTDKRMAAGCTPEIKEENYRDFTGYFFAALTGEDRLGRPVSGADYDHDGKVTMDEAYAYTLIHDESIDTPVCTSDVFLRRFVSVPELDCFKRKYSEVESMASPAQLAALRGLRDYLDLDERGDMQRAYGQLVRSDPESDSPHFVHLLRFCRLYKTIVLAHELESSGTAELKRRYKALIALEHSNPLAETPTATLMATR